jgi:putative membrane protein
LLLGIGVAIIALSHTIERLLEDYPVRMAAAFFGLVVGSIVVTAQRLKLDPARAVTLVVVAVVAFFVLGLRSGPVSDPALWYVFIAGAIAICAMILPGISGSFLLLMLGLYDTILGAV